MKRSEAITAIEKVIKLHFGYLTKDVGDEILTLLEQAFEMDPPDRSHVEYDVNRTWDDE